MNLSALSPVALNSLSDRISDIIGSIRHGNWTGYDWSVARRARIVRAAADGLENKAIVEIVGSDSMQLRVLGRVGADGPGGALCVAVVAGEAHAVALSPSERIMPPWRHKLIDKIIFIIVL